MRCLKIPTLIFFLIITTLSFSIVGCKEGTADDSAKAEPQVNSDPRSALVSGKEAIPPEKQIINEDGKAPKLVFKELSHDFGKQTSGPDLKHTFTFKNEGDGTLMIEKVKAG